MDISWSALRMTAARKSAVDYLLPYYKQHYALVNSLYVFVYFYVHNYGVSTGYKEA